MNALLLYSLQLALTIGLCALLTAYLRPVLRRILVDLCGSQERAQFWTAFANLMLVLVPVMFAIGYNPNNAPASPGLFEMARQMRWNLFGFILSLLGTGMAVGLFALAAPRPQKQGD